ncbi:hypothetical protein NM688_g6722 [Phlebia brevispora]|uniref:Uncharacterized protein n=1 Tax=Phlebia brevispora TaxID=194682 RepID=A0ACC1SD84_9APHY|nr:hypothetical protein NM688_g6722 [Phlebia brevispora]
MSTSAASTSGPVYLGICFSSILYGITCCQTINYYRSERGQYDRIFTKFLVGIVWVLDSVHQGAMMHLGWHYLIVDESNPIAVFLDSTIWSIPTDILLNSIIGALVQSYLVYRIHRLGDNIWITGFSGFWVIAAFAVGITYPIRMYVEPNPIVILTKFQPYLKASLTVSLVGDAIIALFLAFYLYQKRTGFRRSNDIISKLIILTISTGSLTTCVAMASLVSFLVAPFSFYDLFFSFMLSKLYANALLIILNTRDLIHSSRKGPLDANSIPLTRLGFKGNEPNNPQTIDITVSQAVETDVESATKHSLGIDTPCNPPVI